MMELRTEIFPEKLFYPLDYHSAVFSLGSCFTENISKKLVDAKFTVLSNPFGIVYNPISMLNQAERILDKQYFTLNDVFEWEGVYRCYYAHSDLAEYTAQSAVDKLNAAIDTAYNFLKKATHVFITPGTAIVYTLLSSGNIVSNNHKQPAEKFTKRMLSISEVVNALNQLVQKIQAFNPALKIVFTISPVRHLRDGLVENTRSKSLLFSAFTGLQQEFELYYFPAYELVIDDLRDYRFYENDMMHPNALAIQYVWQKFKDAAIDPSCYTLMQSVLKVKQAMQHRPLFDKTVQHVKFRTAMQQEVKRLATEYPHLDFSEELQFFS